jgi:hypothetical protein
VTREEIEARHSELVAKYGSVHECFNPPHINYGAPGVEHRNRCTFVAIKGRELEFSTSPAANHLEECWPEGAVSYAPSGRRLRPRLQRLLNRRGK